MTEPWEKFRDRFNQRPETFEAYVDVWKTLGARSGKFTGWVSFSQAASAEPAIADNRVRDAESLMRQCGYEIFGTTARGARRWRKV